MEAKELLITSASGKATQAGAVTAYVSWLAGFDLVGIGGLAIGVIGLCVNFYFKQKESKRSQAEHLLRMRDLRNECGECEVHNVK